jgi:hypothetical protein
MIMLKSERSELIAWLKLKNCKDIRPIIAKILLMRERGYSRTMIARRTNYSYSRVCDYIRLFEVGGIEAVRPKPRGRPHKLEVSLQLDYRQEHFDF